MGRSGSVSSVGDYDSDFKDDSEQNNSKPDDSKKKGDDDDKVNWAANYAAV